MLKRIIIENYKSIRKCDLPFNQINVLIGENGAGKSNLISFTELMLTPTSELNQYIHVHLGMDRLLHGGSKTTSTFSGTMVFDTVPEEYATPNIVSNECAYSLTIGTAIDAVTPVIYEVAQYLDIKPGELFETGEKQLLGGLEEKARIEQINYEARKTKSKNALATAVCQTYYVQVPLDSIKIYHFCDTDDYSRIRSKANINDNAVLSKSGDNLAAVLYRISKTAPQSYRIIEAMMRRVAPYFDRFNLRPDRLNPNLITIEWKEVGSNAYHDSTSFSDGTIRFLALCVLLLQPDPPATIIIDEPELGLHPSAITIVSGLIKRVSHKSQVIIATQSSDFVSEFSLNDIIVVERVEGQSVFRHLKEEDYEQWLIAYSNGEIWKKNIIGGRP